MACQPGGLAVSSAEAGGYPRLPEPPTAVIQALNKQVAPQRFTEGDARAVRTLAPAVAAGARLIVSLMKCSRRVSQAGGGGGRQRASSFGDAPIEGASGYPEELILQREVRRARGSLGADRARLFVLNSEVNGGRLQLWYDDSLPPLSGWARSSRGGVEGGGCSDVRASMAASAGLEGVALTTGRVARSADALSDSVYDRELDLKEGFLARSVLCAPLFESLGDACEADGSGGSRRGGPLGVLQLAIGRGGGLFDVDHDAGGTGTINRGSGSGVRESRDWTKKKAFVEEDEALAEAFAEKIAGLLSCLLSTGFRPRASATTLVGGGGHVGAGVVTTSCGAEMGVGADASGRRPGPDEEMGGTEGGVRVIRHGETGAARSSGLYRAYVTRPRPPSQADTAEPRPPLGDSSGRGHNGGGASAAADFSFPRNGANGGRETVREVEARDSVVRGPLGSSTTSTAGPSPLGPGVRASVATVSEMNLGDPPLPPSPATDGSNDGSSPDRPPNGEVQISIEHGAIDAPSSGNVKRGRDQTQPTAVAIEATQARSWATAHRVLEACKESLASDKRLRQGSGGRVPYGDDYTTEKKPRQPLAATASSATTTNAERIAPAVRSLVSSLLPGCTAVLLLLDGATGRLWEADCGLGASGGVENRPPPRLVPRRVRREEVARRALASGKALLAQAGEDCGEEAAVVNGGQGDGDNANVYGSSGGDGNGERVFCVPVYGSPGQKFGVLQLFLPPPPRPLSRARSPADLGKAASPTSSRGRLVSSSRGPAAPPPPPPSFFMATKIIADSVGLALGWCEALDREERKRAAEAIACATEAETAAKAQTRRREEVEARHEKGLRAAEERRAVCVAEAADSHARTVASLLEGREALAAAAAGVAARARGRREATRALAAWREASKRVQKSERITARMDERRRARAFCEWKARASTRRSVKNAEGVGEAAANRRGMRRAVRTWARAGARGRCAKERRLAGARLIAELFRRRGPASRYFAVWKVAARRVLAAQEAVARKNTEEKMEALASEASWL